MFEYVALDACAEERQQSGDPATTATSQPVSMNTAVPLTSLLSARLPAVTPITVAAAMATAARSRPWAAIAYNATIGTTTSGPSIWLSR